jgi:hypothetical protein
VRYGGGVGMFNRRNAMLGWTVWQLGKRVGKKKAKGVAPSVEGGKPNKSALALVFAGLAGALTFWRRRSGSGSE